jgi:hypothetical protein
MATAGLSKPDIRGVFAQRDFRALWMAQFVSVFGDYLALLTAAGGALLCVSAVSNAHRRFGVQNSVPIKSHPLRVCAVI